MSCLYKHNSATLQNGDGDGGDDYNESEKREEEKKQLFQKKKKEKRMSRRDFKKKGNPVDAGQGDYDDYVQRFLNLYDPKQLAAPLVAAFKERDTVLDALLLDAASGPTLQASGASKSSGKEGESGAVHASDVRLRALGLSKKERRMLQEFATSNDPREKKWLARRFTPNIMSLLNDPLV